MRTRFFAYSVLSFLLLLLIVLFAGRLIGLGGIRLDLTGGEIDTLAPATVEYLQALDRKLAITFFVSSRAQMPSHLQHVESSVRRLLEAMRRIAPEQVDVRVIDPEVSGAPAATYAARHKVSPVQVGRIIRDQHEQQEIWSSLAIARDGLPEVLIQDIKDADLAYLEQLVLGHLQKETRSRAPRFVVAAPPGFSLLAQALSEYGSVEEIDPARESTFPGACDVLFWMQPTVVSPAHIRSLNAFRRNGCAVVLAGSAYSVSYDLSREPPRYRARTMPDGWVRILKSLGVTVQADLLMDRNSGPVILGTSDGSTRPLETPFNLRCLPAFYDMKSFLMPARGGLSFLSASSLEGDPRRLATTADRIEIVGTTTEHAWVRSLPLAPFDDDDLTPELIVGKQNLMLLLKPDDPWHGPALLLASASPFQDGVINQPGYAHLLFLRNLVRTFAAPERLVRNDIVRSDRDPLPPTSSAARGIWRLFATFLVPAALALLGWRRYAAGGRDLLPPLKDGKRGPLRRGLAVGAVLVAFILLGRLWANIDSPYYDATDARVHTLAPATEKAFARQRDGLQADLFITGRSRLPATMKGAEAQISRIMNKAGIPLRILRPEHMRERERSLLRNRGIAPFELQRVVRDTVVDQTVWSGLQLRRGETPGDGDFTIPRLDTHTLKHLEFLLVAALHRLDHGGPPHVAVTSDLPRLSPAEALEDYQKKGLMAPGGADVYRRLKRLLSDYGYRLSHVTRLDPHLPDDVDLVVWLQPRRDSGPQIILVSEYLYHGGKAIVAMQHFNIQQRQYRGRGFETVYWPQPQFQDFDQYLRLLGIEQVREVLMDRTQSHLRLDTQVNRTAIREYDRQNVALPFLLRTVNANYAAHSPVTGRLGDLLFIWGNRFSYNDDLLARMGLRRDVLISTTSQAWAYAWTGGFLHADVFDPSSFLHGPQPLAVQLSGSFPAAEFVRDADGREQLALRPTDSGDGDGDGQLLLIGNSEMFKNQYLHRPGFHHDQLLLNAVADLTYGDDLAALQARRSTTRGFGYRDPATTAAWRTIVILAGPAVAMGYGIWRFRRRRQPLREGPTTAGQAVA